MTHRQFLRLLNSEVSKSPTRWKAAERLGLSESALSRVLRGKQAPNAELLARFNLTSTTVYLPSRNANRVKTESSAKEAVSAE